MAFETIGSAKENVAALADAGKSGIRTGVSLTQVALPLAGACDTCAKKETHGPPCAAVGYSIPHGQTAQQNVATANKITSDEATRLRFLLWLLRYISYGYTGDVLYNVGAGGNITQRTDYEIVSASGRVATLRGRHPGRIEHGTLIENPDWPGVDENGDPLPRLISRLDVGCIPPGAGAEFLYPSVLCQKQRPFVVRIEYPTTPKDADNDVVEFDVEFSQDITSAKAAFDLKYPPVDGKYYVRLWYEFNSPEPHPNWQPTGETQWARRTVNVNASAAAAGPVALLNSSGGATRVLTPGLTGAFPLAPLWVASAVLADESAIAVTITDAMIATTDSGGGWATTINLQAVAAAYPTLDYVALSYYCEAVALDSTRIPWLGRCANSQFDPTESATHDVANAGWHCTNISCSKFVAGQYRKECWQPSATGFGIGTNRVSRGQVPDPPSSLIDSDWWGRFWTDATWRLDQMMEGMGGARAYQLVRLGGPSFLELAGGFVQRVPGGQFPRRELWRAPVWGVREDVAPEDIGETGNGTKQIIRHGLWIRSVPQDTATTAKIPGLVPTIVSGWRDRADALGVDSGTHQEWLECYNRFPVGNHTAYDYQHQQQALGTRAQISSVEEDFFHVSESLCFRVRGTPLRMAGSLDAGIYNEILDVLTNWDLAWAEVRYGGSAPNIAGNAYQHIIATGYACSSTQAVPTGLAVGVTGATIDDSGVGFPFWQFNASVNGYAFVDSDAEGSETLTCSGNDLDIPNATTGGMATEVYPEGRNSVGGEPAIFWGMGFSETLPVPFAGEGSIIGVTGLFKFPALAFSARDIIPHLPTGATIVEARIEFKADGLRSREESITTEVSASVSVTNELVAVPVSRTQSRNGVVYYQWDDVNGETVNDTPAADRVTSPIGFQLVAVRNNTTNLELFDGTEVALPDNRFTAIGTVSAVTTATDGEWTSVDVTGAINAILSDHGTENGSYQLWPANAANLFASSAGALSQYARGLIGSFSVSATTDGGGIVNGWTASASGTYTYCDAIAFGRLLVRVSVDGMDAGWRAIPRFRRPFVAEV